MACVVERRPPIVNSHHHQHKITNTTRTICSTQATRACPALTSLMHSNFSNARPRLYSDGMSCSRPTVQRHTNHTCTFIRHSGLLAVHVSSAIPGVCAHTQGRTSGCSSSSLLKSSIARAYAFFFTCDSARTDSACTPRHHVPSAHDHAAAGASRQRCTQGEAECCGRGKPHDGHQP